MLSIANLSLQYNTQQAIHNNTNAVNQARYRTVEAINNLRR